MIKAFKIQSMYDEINGFRTNKWYDYPEDKKRKKKLENIMKHQNEHVKVHTIEDPSIGDECYFFNRPEEKMSATVDGKPFLGVLEKIENGKYVPENCDFVFNYAEKKPS